MKRRKPKAAARNADRSREAFELRKRGLTFEQIGDRLGISRQAAHQMVTKRLDECIAQTKSDAKQVVEMELHRLDAMIAALWDEATTNPPADTSEGVASAMYESRHDAIDRVLKLMERRAKYLGLDAANRTELTGADGGPIAIEDARTKLRAKLARLDVTGGAGVVPAEPDGTGTTGS